METVGYIRPSTSADAREIFEELGPAAGEVTREIALAMEFDAEEFDRRVTDDVVETARGVLFSTLLTVRHGTQDGFEDWRSVPPQREYELHKEGAEHVDHVAWHASPCAEAIVAATYQDEPEAAVTTLRRIAWGRLYRPLFHDPQ